ncbi:hypothetical protein WJX73_003770 [Symbiochloris irregularis]|uniref:MYND-type domain-containing protein n=1 Tax=Symbiochloris irregularis TaxID=706552 RepID=A0AAW1PSQ5_9CHLO
MARKRGKRRGSQQQSSFSPESVEEHKQRTFLLDMRLNAINFEMGSPEATKRLFNRAIAKAQGLSSHTSGIDPSKLMPRTEPDKGFVEGFLTACTPGERLSSSLPAGEDDAYLQYRMLLGWLADQWVDNGRCGLILAVKGAGLCAVFIIKGSRETQKGVPLLEVQFLSVDYGCTKEEAPAIKQHMQAGRLMHSDVEPRTIWLVTAVLCSLPASAHCSRCQDVRYCSRTCQAVHWPQHKASCRADTAAQDSSSDDDLSDAASSYETLDSDDEAGPFLTVHLRDGLVDAGIVKDAAGRPSFSAALQPHLKTLNKKCDGLDRPPLPNVYGRDRFLVYLAPGCKGPHEVTFNKCLSDHWISDS